MSVVYSVGARLGGSGIGSTALHAVAGLQRHNLLHRLLCGSYLTTAIPAGKIRSLGLASRLLQKLATYDRRLWIRYLERTVYDHWASRQLEPAGIFHVWNSYGMRSLKRASSLGMITVLERASSHPEHQRSLIEAEYNHWGLAYNMPAGLTRRSISEIHLADYILVPSNFVKTSFLQQGYLPEKIIEIPFGVDIHKFHPRGKNSSATFRVLFVGTIGLRKGVVYLLEAWRQLDWKDAQLYLVGRVESSFQSLLEGYRHLPGLRIFDYVQDPVPFFQSADIFAFPTIEEGSALVTYEAMASGLPQITTPNAGAAFQDSQEGFLVPIRDPDALAARMEALRSNPALREEMSAAARARSLQLTWAKYGQRLSRLYTQLIQLEGYHGNSNRTRLTENG